MEENILEHKKQLERESKEITKHIRMMIKVVIYTSFFLILVVVIDLIIRGFMYGFT